MACHWRRIAIFCHSFLFLLGIAWFGRSQHALAYELVREHRGISFFDRFDFYGGPDNLTMGNVNWVDRDTAYGSNLAYINAANNAILKVDNNSTVKLGDRRNSIRLTSQDSYSVGSLWIIDILHLPYGCSVWPAFWTVGPKWPDDGEIDIIEQINLADANQYALHSVPGCFQSVAALQTGLSGGDLHLSNDCSSTSGCVVKETAANSFGADFANAGGGVWATQFDVKGVFIWFWSRPNVPPSLQVSIAPGNIGSVDMSTWGPPSAAYWTSGCNVPEYFSPQQLVIDITLCGNWAGINSTYGPQCAASGPTGICYNDNVVGDGRNYDNAYFEIQHLRAYTTGGVTPTPSPATPGAAWQNGSLVTNLPTNTGAAARAASPPSGAAWTAWTLALVLGGVFAGFAVIGGDAGSAAAANAASVW